ncbi:site-specific integrase [Microbacterium aurum]|uniref:tyrosine-type recombinase/integrase n=1 Tax=Microbacterium aurum TaxID=36805 RepID=UPI0028E4C00F|nr:site-specific integrase [Microbacterium aurum]
MASIKQRPDGVWRARYRDAAGKEHARHFPLKRDAQRWIDEVTASVVTGQYVDPKAARLTFREYAETWLTAQVHRDATATLYRGHLERHAYPVLGDLPLGSVLRTTVQGWVKGLTVDAADGARKALSPATIGVVYTVVASVFRAAVRDRKLAATPCDGIALPEVSKARVQPLTTAQVDLLAEYVPAELRALVILAAGTGMRQGEVLGLTRDRLRLLGKSPAVTVDRQLVTRPKGETGFAPPKTAASVRRIPLPRVVVDALNDHLARYDVGDGELLFRLDGKGITRQRFGHLWRPAAAAAGLTAATGTGMHALRHYYASLLIRYGESVKTVQGRLGHKSATETLDTYGHMWADSDDRTRDAVDSILGAPRDSADSPRTADGASSANA